MGQITVKLNQETYEKLKSRATFNYRTLSGEVDYLLDKADDQTAVGGTPDGNRVYEKKENSQSSTGTCHHGYALGFCKKPECNRANRSN